jgi:hypothetical protein
MLEKKGVVTVLPEEHVTGRLDRSISEMLWLVDHPHDDVSIQTIKHHAEDMIGAGQEILKRLEKYKEKK